MRRRSVGHIIGELEQVLADFPGMEYINFQDDCFLICTVKFLTEFCHAYRERVGVPFIARTTPSSITDERLGLLKDAGLAWINMALQSGSERICQDIYNRRSLPKHFVEAARVIHRHKIAAFYDVIMDNPWETEQDQLDSVRVLIDTPKPFFTQLFSLTFYSGTAVRERAEKECPGAIEDPTAKNYRVLRRRPVNDLVEIATTMHAPVMRWLVRRYEQSPGSAGTRLAILLAKWYSRALLAPLTVLREIRMSKGGSWTKTLRVLPSYFGMALTYYRTLFQSLFLGR